MQLTDITPIIAAFVFFSIYTGMEDGWKTIALLSNRRRTMRSRELFGNK